MSAFGEEIMSLPTKIRSRTRLDKPTAEWVALQNDIHNFLETMKTQITKQLLKTRSINVNTFVVVSA
jgi:hypothetical protein